MRFPGQHSLPDGCATMLPVERFELDIPSQGSSLIGWLDAAFRMAVRRMPSQIAPRRRPGRPNVPMPAL